MPDAKVTDLTEVTDPQDADWLYLVDVTDNSDKKVQRGSLTAPLRVVNNSGATANAGEVGYLDSDGSYKTTTTGGFVGNWVVVVIGGANGSTIYVNNQGRYTIKFTGATPSQGDFLVMGTVAGKAATQGANGFHYGVMAVALAAGNAGAGTVDALLLCRTSYVATNDSNFVYHVATHSTTDFRATINGAPSSTSVVFSISSGNADTIKPSLTTDLARVRLYNETRGTYRLISDVNTGTSTITTVSSSDSWASGDTITTRSQTANTGSSPYFYDLDLSQQSVIPAHARALVLDGGLWDGGGSGKFLALHPFEIFAASKQSLQYNQASSVWNYKVFTVPLVSRRFCWRGDASGTGQRYTNLLLAGYLVAVP